MQDSISPYALLCASKPKPAASIVTPYDLYSAAHHPADTEPTPPSAAAMPMPAASAEPDAANSLPRTIPQRRTHYIQDIHDRHNQAAKRGPHAPRPF